MTDLEIARKVYERADELARRWVKAWDSGYNSVHDLYLNWDTNTIQFNAQYPTPGVGMRQNISMKYLEDDSTLEIDAKKYYDEFESTRLVKVDRRMELENNPLVQEYKNLTNPVLTQNIMPGDCFYSSIFYSDDLK